MIPLHRPTNSARYVPTLAAHYAREERIRTWVLWLAVLGCTLASMLCFGWLLIGGGE